MVTARLLVACTLVGGVLALSCGGAQRETERARIGYYPGAESLWVPEAGPDWGQAFTGPLGPAVRSDDLAVLVLSTESRAFSSLVVPATRLGLLREWVQPLSPSRPLDLRPDLGESLREADGLTAIPLTLRVPLLLYSLDAWERHDLPAPADWTTLREALWTLRSWDPATRGRLAVGVSGEALFWSAAWCIEKDFSEALYTPGKVRALVLLKEWSVLPGSASVSAEDALLSGQAAAGIVYPEVARRILAVAEREGARFGVSPLPCGDRPRALNDGWCVIARTGAHLGDFADIASDGKTYRALTAKGLEPGVQIEPARRDQVARCVEGTILPTFILSSGALALAGDAAADVLAGSASPEEALRRAQARSQEAFRESE